MSELDYIEDIEKLQHIIETLQQENQQLKADLEMYENGVYFSSENDKLQEENTQLRIEISAIEEDYRKLEKIVKDVGMWNTLYNEELNKNKKLEDNWKKLKQYIKNEPILYFMINYHLKL